MSKAKHEPRPLMKRFYKAVGHEAAGEGYVITLDGKRIKTPAKKLLCAPSEALAAAIAAEWMAQGEHIDTDAMPLTRLLNITLDRVAADRAALLSEINAYGETDLLCYRMPRHVGGVFDQPTEKLRAQQDATFDPILAWAARTYGIRFITTEGIMPIAQEEASLGALAAQFAQADDAQLAALSLLVPILGSALLVLAVWKECVSIDEALIAARLDEDAQVEQWGYDHEVISKWNAKCADARAAAFFLTGK